MKNPHQIVKDWSPGKVFLADAIGALVTSGTLGLVLVQFNEYFGLSKQFFHFLALFVLPYCIYSISILLAKPINWPLFLKGIALANAGYCVLTLSLVFLKRETATVLGITYFMAEALIIFFIAYVEWRYANSYKMKPFR